MARTYGWDASHFDGTLTKAILVKAAAEGIAFFTHKLGQGLNNTDPEAGTALAAARDAGIQLLGGYYFIEDADSPVAQAQRCIALADEHEPWWRDFPGWFWQTDAERDGSGVLPTPAHVKAFSDALASESGRRVIVYASHGMYGNRLAGLGHPLWNANYPSSGAGTPAAIYPGDSFSGWDPYSGQTPAIVQFSSSARIAGLTTCDANAFKGTVDDFLTLIGADMPLTGADSQTLFETDGFVPNFSWAADAKTNGTIKPISAIIDAGNEAHAANLNAAAAVATLAGIVKTEAAIQTALAGLIANGGSADSTALAALAAQIKAVGDTESTHVATLQQTINQQLATIATLKADLLAAAQASAAALAK